MKTLIAALILSSSMAHAERFIVESSHGLKEKELSQKNFEIRPFYPTTHEYFSRLYVVSGNISMEELQKMSWVKLVEPAIEISMLSLIPAENSVNPVEDELFPYQWGMMNQGQTYYREKDDIHSMVVKGELNKDIGWAALMANLPKNRPIVAVLDSGVDLNHPELVNNLWKNEDECGKDPLVDNDNNKLAGDCHGWNFTEAIDSEAAKDPSDKDGHGTHVAGIIAAAMNGRGIVGVAPNALIMPIKVMKDSGSKSQVASSESFARGIIYATDNGADVINMSLGWPRSLETKFLREAVQYALSQGVVIVAAAGNNNSHEPLFPCAYEGVICVAASSIDGNFASFSNYGGHVDVVAPGEVILSTNPLIYEPEFFAVPGYELRSGTSQSAPFVAGLIASLKAQKKGIKIDEVFARMYQTKKSSDSKKYVLGGDATWESVAQEVTGPVVRPVLKRVRQVVLRGKESKLMVPVRNFGLTSGMIEVKIEILSSGVKITSGPQRIGPFEQGQGQEVLFDVEVDDFSIESNIKMKVILTEEHGTHSYINQIPVVRDIRNEPAFKKLDLAYRQGPLPVGGVRNGEITSFLTTMESYAKSNQHDYFLNRILKDDAGTKLEVTIFNRKGDKFQESIRPVFVENAIRLVNLIRVDLDLDGKEDYLVHALAEKDNQKYFVFSFYNSKMEALWPTFQDVKVNLNVYVENMNDLSFMNYQHPTLGKILVPAFFTVGQIPKIDLESNGWTKPDNSSKTRLYYLEPKVSSFDIRTLTTNSWEEAVKKELKSKWYETVETQQLLPASEEDIRSGKLRVLVSVGVLTLRKLFIYSLDTKTIQHGPMLPQQVLQYEGIDPLLSVGPKGLKVIGETYFNIYDRERAKIVSTSGLEQTNELNFEHNSDFDVVAGHLVSFENKKNGFTVLQTREELISISTGTSKKTTRRAKLRYSFLSQKLLTEMYRPVTYLRDGNLAPALYVDATAITGNRIYLLEEQNGSLVSSIRNSIVTPSNCKSVNPVFSETAGTHQFIFLCLEEKDWVVRSYDMK